MKDLPHILVIDDDPAISISLAGFLEDHDYHVKACFSAESALESLQTHAFDIAVVDMRLPGMSGEGFIIQAHALYPRLRFLIYTGSAAYRLSDEMRAIGIKPEHVLLKPVRDLGEIDLALKSIAKASAP